MGKISYKKLFAFVKEKYGTETLYLRNNGFSPTLVNKLKNDKTVTTETLVKLCDLLGCQLSDILEYIPDDTDSSQK